MTNDYIAPFVAVTRTLKTLIERDVLASAVGDESVQVSFEVPDKEFVSSLPEVPVLNIYLYSLQENLERRYGEAFPVMAVSEDRSQKTIGRQPRLVDLNYMISAWSMGLQERALVEQYLLSRVVQGLGRHQTMPIELLQEQSYDPGPSGVVMKMLLDQDSKRTQGEFWNALGAHPKPVLNLELTVPVPVHTPVTAPVVANLQTRIGNMDHLPDDWDTGPEHNLAVSGFISAPFDFAPDDITIHARSVGSPERWAITPANDGFYFFPDLPDGEYLLWAEHAPTDTATGKQVLEVQRDDNGQRIPASVDITFPTH
ncbi:DUF4255 domain-containing protein [Kistimonas asteriae]|uniref:DUF4255 domain-containing protein n=1 Tax=Kistimonas asteriae TaxID=517724 RepID=UPI001BAD4D9C|nr:DUF4255 domain-containing protein [Kistimonas asteriae]